MMRSMLAAATVAIALSLLLAGCASVERGKAVEMPPLIPLRIEQYPVFGDDLDYNSLAQAIDASVMYLKRLPADRSFQYGPDATTAAEVIRTLTQFKDFATTKPSKEDLNRHIRRHYQVYRASGKAGKGRVLFSGYYEPDLNGSLKRQGPYQYPLYARPEDMVTIDLQRFSKTYKDKRLVGRLTAGQRVVPYHDRSEIDDLGQLDGKAGIVVWVDDPIDRFFLQIQGSGKVYLAGGGALNVHYHIANGHPYRSIGKLLIQKGAIAREDMSMQAIRTYLRNHPEQMQAVFNYNPSYVFFKTETEGPLGSINVVLTPGRSIATDRRLFPKAALVFVAAQKPLMDGERKIDRWVTMPRFYLNQDTGGAIRGAGRADLFWGNGPYAEVAAGHMRHVGEMFFLLLKSETSPILTGIRK